MFILPKLIMNMNKIFSLTLLALLLFPLKGGAQELSQEVRDAINKYLDTEIHKEICVGKIKVDSVAINKKTIELFANKNAADYPFRIDNVNAIYKGVQELLPTEYSNRKLKIYANGKAIEELIPINLREKKPSKKELFAPKTGKQLVTNIDALYTPTNGLTGRHLAMWQSHGWYYEQKLSRWEWQRARVLQTVEDLYTQSYVLPFLVPMLENAGANVLLPRERDCNPFEVIVDNDGALTGNSAYTEKEALKKWTTGEKEGFAHKREQYLDGQNPFREGTFRQIETLKKGEVSIATWTPEIPQAGQYAVYVSYKSLPKSTDDALYTVHHKGGKTQFKVNQQMGGGTWIYLGTFSFDKGKNDAGCVTLSNLSAKNGRIVTADAVKIGGGMGNVARCVNVEGPTENLKSSDAQAQIGDGKKATVLIPVEETLETSGYPRFCEGARYWMLWAGVPDSVYSDSKGKNDYTDDYKSRGIWVNWLAGGSAVNPKEEGLNIPVDLAFAFHTDAGTTLDDSIIGTLGIYYTNVYEGKYSTGASRYLAHDMTDLIATNIVRDIRANHEPNWSRRGMWNSSYYEARVPRVPTMLLELLSHQNFADMRLGLDPRFRFTVSRAIYKGMLQFLCAQRGIEYVVQPLPVDHMAVSFTEGDEVELTWEPVADPLEPTANAEQYIVYTRIGNGAFDNGVLVTQNSYRTRIPTGEVCSFKVTAVNRGGESFPSEILSIGKANNAKGEVLVVNGFDRISAPADFVAPGPAGEKLAGFRDDLDHGVPYLNDISYIGKMKEFRREIPWMDDDASGFGDSYANYETQVIAGNTFDYPAVHGAAILKAGFSFVSCSDEAVESGKVALNKYKHTDLILGKEWQTKMGRGVMPLQYKTFSKAMQDAITVYCNQGGNIFVSGAYVGSDLWDNPLCKAEDADKKFATEVLKYKWRVNQAATEGKVKCVSSPLKAFKGQYTYQNVLSSDSYVVESPDAIEPATKEAFTIMRYSENNLSAGTAYKGAYKTCVLGFPFETIRTSAEREALMNYILTFFNEQ